jgi:hypothetical protein
MLVRRLIGRYAGQVADMAYADAVAARVAGTVEFLDEADSFAHLVADKAPILPAAVAPPPAPRKSAGKPRAKSVK